MKTSENLVNMSAETLKSYKKTISELERRTQATTNRTRSSNLAGGKSRERSIEQSGRGKNR